LTRRGVAVLRVDDRGVGGSTRGKNRNATTADFADDARAGVAFLKGRKEIDPRRIGLIGHSEGGMIAPIVAADTDDVAFIVLLAGTGVRGDRILQTQGAASLKANGATEKQVAFQRRLQERLFAVIKEEKDKTAAEKRLREVITDESEKLDEDEKKALGNVKSQVEAQIPLMLSAWLHYFLEYDPRPTLMKVRCPVLAINGEKDVQVDAKINLAAIGEALKAGGNIDFTVKELPNLNHLFQTATTGSVLEYGKIEETFAPAALELIGDWVVKRTAR
jgi:pimeloyl-ACP methyl ester carboxylesterase